MVTAGQYQDDNSELYGVSAADTIDEAIMLESLGDLYGSQNVTEYKGQYVFEMDVVELDATSIMWVNGNHFFTIANMNNLEIYNTTLLDAYLEAFPSDLEEEYNEIELSENIIVEESSYTFAPTEPGIYNVTAIYGGRFELFTNWWRVVYSDAPISEELTGSLIGMTNLSSATDVTIEKASVGGVDFGDEVLDLTGFVDIDSIITIEHAKIGIDTTVFTGFDKPATLTMYGLTSPGTPIILKDGVECGTECNVTSYADGTLVFTVAGFSVYEAKDNIAADLSLPATATLGSSAQERNQTIKGSFIASNFGTDRAINDFNLTCNADNMYKVNFSTTEGGPWTESLSDLDFEIGENKTIYMKGFIPFSQDSGSNVEICKIEMDNGQMQRSTSLVINPISKLGFHKLTVYVDGDKDTVNRDGDTVSDLKPESRIKVKAELKNLFTDEEDIEIQDAFFEIIAENLDEDEDIEEESKEVDLRPERDKDLTIEFDVPLEIDEDTYNMVVKAEGEDEKGATHTLEWTVILDVEKDNHDIRISRASLGSSELACTRSTIFTVEIKNVGSKDEEDVKLVVNNPDLGIDYIKTGLDLDVYGDDDEFSKSFSINLADDFPTGTYPIEVDVDYNGKSSDRKTVDLVVNECTRVDYTADKEDPEVITPSDLQPLDTEEFPDFEQKIEEKVSGWYIAVLIVLIIAILVVFMYTLSLIRK